MRERGGNYELTDDAPSAGTEATLWAPYFAPDEPSIVARWARPRVTMLVPAALIALQVAAS